MRTAMRPRYYCDHCNKGNGSPSAMRRHERGCTLNPQRECGMCKMVADEVEGALSRDELVRVMDEQGFKAMCEAANHCPACILAALRTMAGPPMSMFSMASSSVQSALATVLSNG